MAISCAQALEALIADYDTFIQGGAAVDVVLSDAHTMPSYQKFSIDELSRTGGLWSLSKTYLIDDIITKAGKMYVALQASINKDPAVETTYWKEITKTGANSGFGISGYCSFLLKTGDILASKEVITITILNASEFLITVSDKIRVGVGNRIVYAFSYDQTNLTLSEIADISPHVDGHFEYFIAGRTTLNNDNQIQIKVNSSFINWSPRIDLIFLEV